MARFTPNRLKHNIVHQNILISEKMLKGFVAFFLPLRFPLPKRGCTQHGSGETSFVTVYLSRFCDETRDLTPVSSLQWLHPGVSGHL